MRFCDNIAANGSFDRSETSPLALLCGGLPQDHPRWLPGLDEVRIKESCKMDHDLLLMLYGALIGAASRILTTMIEAALQRWLQRREQERHHREELHRQATQIYLPTVEEVQAINSERYQEHEAAAPRKAVGTGSIVLSVVGGGFVIHQARDPMLSLGFAALVSFLMTHNALKRLKR